MQLVKFKWNVNRDLTGEPSLVARRGSELVNIPLLENRLDLNLGKKTCIGHNRKGKYYSCPKSREITTEKMCRECVLNDDFFMCVKCDGSECLNDSQRNDCAKNNYHIYLAAFSSVLKVGISHEFRLIERLVEQGADMGAKIGTVQDGKLVREIEQKIRKELGIIDRVSGEDKQKMIFGNINTASINIFNAYSKLKMNGISKYLVHPEIYNFQNIYRLYNVQSHPAPLVLEEGARIHGDVLASKGNIIILRNNDGLFSVNASKLIGFEVN